MLWLLSCDYLHSAQVLLNASGFVSHVCPCFGLLTLFPGARNEAVAFMYYLLAHPQEICIGILGNMACAEAICAEEFGSSEQMCVGHPLYSVPRLSLSC